MLSPLPPRQESAKDSPYFARRLAILGILGAALLLLIAARVAHLTVLRSAYYQEKSNDNVRHEQAIQASRGIISDRFGRSLVSTQVEYAALLEPDGLTSTTLTQTLRRFEELTGVDPRPALKGLRIPDSPDKPIRSRLSLKLAGHLSATSAALVAERLKEEMPGVFVQEVFARSFTANCPPRALSHVIGYTGFPSSEEELARLAATGEPVDPSVDQIGKKGIEYFYDPVLRGEKGLEVQLRDARQLAVGAPTVLKPARGGADLLLTIDADLQSTASQLMEGFHGALVALDPRNGEVLAMVSKPDFESYPLQPGDSEWNNATRTPYPPGSTFKPIVAAAALRAGIPPETTFVCDKVWTLGNTTFKCLFAHGALNMTEALRSSCNIYFYNLARQLRWGPIAQSAREFGYGARAGIDLYPPDNEGVLGWPPNERAAQSCDGEVVQMAIGEAAKIDATPLQMALAYAAIANPQGLLLTPHLALETRYGDGRAARKVVTRPRGTTPASDPDVRDALLAGLRQVVESQRGTAHSAGFDPAWKVAGKTGTAEPGGGRAAHAWFIGFAPFDDPEICVAIVCEESGHGGEIAAPVARSFLQVYFEQTRPKLKALEAQGHPPVRVSLQD